MAKPKKNRYDGKDQFPIHYEKDGIRVFTNPAGELFVEQVLPDGNGAQLQFGAHTDQEGLRFTTSDQIDPEVVNHMVSWHIFKRR